MRWIGRTALLAATGTALLLALSGPASAVKTGYWTEDSVKSFLPGTRKDVVITSRGVLRLSREAKSLIPESEDTLFVNALAEDANGTIYAATGPKGIVWRIAPDGKAEKFAMIAGAPMLFSLTVGPGGDVYVGSGGNRGEIIRITPAGRATVLFSRKDVRYIWAMAWDEDDHLYAATGTPARVYRISPDGTADAVCSADAEKNFVSLAYDRTNGRLYAGSDTNGLVYRIGVRDQSKPFILVDALENEISVLSVDAAGNVIAATADSRGLRALPGGAQVGPSGEGGGTGGSGGGAGMAVPPDNESRFARVPLNDPRPAAVPVEREPAAPAIPAYDPFEAILAAKLSGAAAPAQRLTDPPARPDLRPPAARPQAEPLRPLPQVAFAAPAEAEPRQEAPEKPETGKVSTKAGNPIVQSNLPTPGANAVYRIAPTGYAETILRTSGVAFLSMAWSGDDLLLGTGNDGRLVQLDTADGEYQSLLKLKAAQVTAVLRARNGRIYLGTANGGGVSRLEFGYFRTGQFVGKPMDAQLVSKWGRVSWDGATPPGTKVTVSTRSGNVAEPADDTWSPWSPELEDAEGARIASPPARFLQYRVTLESADGTATPELRSVKIAYVTENQRPRVREVNTSFAAGSLAPGAGVPSPLSVVNVRWSGEDPNSDTLQYAVEFREVGDRVWIPLEAKTRLATYKWDTLTVRDGRYEVRITASDAPENPEGSKSGSLISDAFTIDNTRPDIETIDVRAVGRGEVEVTVRAKDGLSPIAGATYSVDSNTEFVGLNPQDGIFDSRTEAFVFRIRDLPAGEHRLAFRVWDSQNNTAHGKQTIRIGG